MTSKLIMTRQYKDGYFDRHEKNESEIYKPTVYTLFRHDTDVWDNHSVPTLYSIVADYRDGKTYGNWMFDNLHTAVNCFHRMVSVG